MTSRVWFAMGVVALLLASACGGGGSDAGGGGVSKGAQSAAKTPDRAVSLMLEALQDGSRKNLLAVIEPDLRDSPSVALGLGPLKLRVENVLKGVKDTQKFTIVQTAAQSNWEDDKSYARVNLTGTVNFGSDITLKQEVLTAEIDGRWYVSSAENAYWKGVLAAEKEREAQMRDPVVAAFAAQRNDDPSLPGTYYKPHPGRDGRLCEDRACASSMDDRNHITPGTSVPICSAAQIASGNFTEPLCYSSNPPTSGPHASSFSAWRVLPSPATKEQLVHNMEHGGVVVWYNTTNATVISQLEGIVGAEAARGRFVVMSRYSEMEPDTVALTAWTRLDKFPASQFNAARVQTFINRHHKRFNPEGF